MTRSHVSASWGRWVDGEVAGEEHLPVVEASSKPSQGAMRLQDGASCLGDQGHLFLGSEADAAGQGQESVKVDREAVSRQGRACAGPRPAEAGPGRGMKGRLQKGWAAE